MSDRTEDEARRLLRKLEDAAKLDSARVYIPGKGLVIVKLPRAEL